MLKNSAILLTHGFVGKEGNFFAPAGDGEVEKALGWMIGSPVSLIVSELNLVIESVFFLVNLISEI